MVFECVCVFFGDDLIETDFILKFDEISEESIMDGSLCALHPVRRTKI